MPRHTTVLATLSVTCLLGGCAASHSGPAHVHRVEASQEADDKVLGALASLEGEWQLVDENGNLVNGSEFKLTSAGSVVREIMFPGDPHEMTNTYHMDGTKVVCTHYCAAGNQPRMVATGMEDTPDGPSLHFKLDSVSNYRKDHDHYMGELRLTLVDANTIHQDWKSLDANGEVANEMTFVMKRVH